MVRVTLAALLSLSLAACGGEEDESPFGELAQALEAYPNARPAYDFFRLKGLSDVQSAGILGNLIVESRVDPTIVSPNGRGRGIAQWQTGGRWDTAAAGNVIAFAASRGQDPLSLALQLEFIWFELTTISSYGLTELRAATTVSEATLVFMRRYEGCPSCSSARRIDFAEQVLEDFGGTPPSGSSSGGPQIVTCTIDTGAEGECVSTDECADRGGQSSPGYCPGPNGIQCCTGVPSSSSGDGGGSSGSGANPEPEDESQEPDATGTTGGRARPRDLDDDEAEPGGCNVAASAGLVATDGLWLLAGLLGVCRRRRATTAR